MSPVPVPFENGILSLSIKAKRTLTILEESPTLVATISDVQWSSQKKGVMCTSRKISTGYCGIKLWDNFEHGSAQSSNIELFQ